MKLCPCCGIISSLKPPHPHLSLTFSRLDPLALPDGMRPSGRLATESTVVTLLPNSVVDLTFHQGLVDASRS